MTYQINCVVLCCVVLGCVDGQAGVAAAEHGGRAAGGRGPQQRRVRRAAHGKESEQKKLCNTICTAFYSYPCYVQHILIRN